jgi:monofunctional biosynthetic peptidoglycan transglycosylase
MSTPSRRRRAGKILRWTFRVLLALLIADLIYVAAIWPDWEQYASGPVPKSSFIKRYEATYKDKKFPRLKWQPVAIGAMPRHLQRAVLVAEDWRFYRHNGFDLEAIRDALDYNMEKKRIVFGASTISQQTAKNLFLSPSRDPLRKWHEILFTIGLERHLGKRRILEIYLNIAEFGRGVYGVQAASLHYFGVPVAAISWDQAMELAATLPGPRKNNPANRTRYYARHLAKLKRLFARIEPAPPEVAGADVPPTDRVEPLGKRKPLPKEEAPPQYDAPPPDTESPAPETEPSSPETEPPPPETEIVPAPSAPGESAPPAETMPPEPDRSAPPAQTDPTWL